MKWYTPVLASTALFLGCDLPEPQQIAAAASSVSVEEPAGETDLFERVGSFDNAGVTHHFYCLSRAESSDVIIEQAKQLVKKFKPGKDVVDIFNSSKTETKKGVLDYIGYRQMINEGDRLAKENGTIYLHPDYDPKLKKWLGQFHFAMISYVNYGSWELMQMNKVAFRKFNNKGEPIPL